MPSASAVRAGQAYVELSARLDLINEQLKKGLQKVKAFGDQAANFARVNIVATFTAAVPIAKVTDDYSKFDDKMRVVQATTKATGRDFELLTELARKLGRTTSFTAQQVADGMVALGRSGFNSSEIQDIIGNFLNLSRSTATELPRSIEIAASVLRGFNLDAKESERVVDVLTVATNGSAQTLEDLGDAFKYVVPLARESGMTLEESAKAVAFLANMGIKGSMAATALRNVLVRMSTSDIQEKYRELGVEVVDSSTGGFRKLSDIMKDLSKSLKELPSSEKLGIFRELFGLFGLAGGASLAGGVDFDELFKGIDEAAGRAAEVAEMMDAGLGGAKRLSWSEVVDVFLETGKVLAQTVIDALGDVKQLTDGVKTFIDENKDGINSVLQMGVAMAKLTLAIAEGVAKFLVANPLFGQLLVIFQGLMPLLYGVSFLIKNIASILQVARAVVFKFITAWNNINGVTAAVQKLTLAVNNQKAASQAYLGTRAAEQKAYARLANAQARYNQEVANGVAGNGKARQALVNLQAAQATHLQSKKFLTAANIRHANALKLETTALNAYNKTQLKYNAAVASGSQKRIAAWQAKLNSAAQSVAAAKVLVKQEAQAVINATTKEAIARRALIVAQNDYQVALKSSNASAIAKAQASLNSAKSSYAEAVANQQAAKAALAKANADKFAASQAAKAAAAVAVQRLAYLALGASVLLLVGYLAYLIASGNKAKKVAEETAEKIDSQGQVLEQKQNTENSAMERLVELSKKQKLSNAEMDEAQTIVSVLTKAYGDLGISIDKATGKITGLTEAQSKLNAKQKQALIGQKTAEIAAKKAIIEANEKDISQREDKGAVKRFFARQNPLFGFMLGEKSSKSRSLQEINDDNRAFIKQTRDIFAATGFAKTQNEVIAGLKQENELERARIKLIESEIEMLNARNKSENITNKENYSARANLAAKANEEIIEQMFGKQEAKKSPSELFDEYAKNLDSEYYNRYVDLEKKKGTLDKYIMSQETFEKEWGSKRSGTRERNSRIPLLNELQGRFEKGENWLAEQNRQEANNKKLYDQNKELGSAYEVLAKAISDNNTQAITEAQKQVEEAKKASNSKALEVAMDNYKASQDAANVALRAYEEAKAASDTLPEQLNLLREEMLQARANEMEMNSALASAVSAAGKDMDDSLSGISPMGTFGRLEFLDRGGSNALLEEAKQQKELLRTLDFSVKRIAGTLSDTGEFV